MKGKKKIIALCGAAVLALAIAGCSQQSSQAEYIGIDAAKAIALEDAGVAESEATFSTTGLDRRDGTDYYAVDFTAGGQSYEYDIDPVTGTIISGTAPQTGDDGADDTSAAPASPDVSPSTQETQTVTSPAPSPSAQTGSDTNAAITEEKARQIALEHAGLSADQVTFLKSRLDWDDGRQVYDIEFYTASYEEYDYEIDAATGAIVSCDYDAEGYTPPASGTTTITADRAKEIALAEVPGATVNDIYEFEVDRDDGRLEYEGTIWYNGVEYEFTIDGYSGAIRSWEADTHH